MGNIGRCIFSQNERQKKVDSEAKLYAYKNCTNQLDTKDKEDDISKLDKARERRTRV